MNKYLVGTVALLTLAFTSLGSAAGAPSTADTGRSVASRVASTASGQCSKAEAIDAVKRLGLRDVSATYPVWKVLCGAFAGTGSQVMVASISGFENVGMLYWAVFRWSGGEWQFLMKQRQVAILTAAGSDIRETVSIYRTGDPRCCPSGGTKTRIWHWNGARFVAGPWSQGAAGNGKSTRAYFFSPSGNLDCQMGDDGKRHAAVICQSHTPPSYVGMDVDGRLHICRGVGCVGNPGVIDVPKPTVLGYGRQITVGRFRCQSLQIGFRCTVIRSGKGFLINRDGVSRVGP